MSEIITTNGGLRVKESYDKITNKLRDDYTPLIEFTEIVEGLKYDDVVLTEAGERKVTVNINNVIAIREAEEIKG